jgi:hypothetical protein
MLAPALSLRLGDRIYAEQVAALTLRRARLPGIDRLSVLFPPAVPVDAAPGDAVTLELDGGEGAETVFTGRVGAIRRRFDGITVTALGPAERLAAARPALALERVTAGEAIRRLAETAEVETGEIAPGPMLAIYAADGRSSALAEIVRLASFTGAQAAFDGDGKLTVPDPARPIEPLPLRYGREIISIDAAQGAAAASPVVIGEGGDPSGPQARWIVADFLRGGGASGDRIALPEIRTRQDADTAARAIAAARTARARTVTLTTFLLPALAPGRPVSLADMPEGVGLAGMGVDSVLHQLSASGPALSTTRGPGGDGSGGLLGAAAGAFA